MVHANFPKIVEKAHSFSIGIDRVMIEKVQSDDIT